MASKESLYQEKMQEIQKQMNALMQTINTNSKVVAFMNSPVGHYLEEHPFLSLSLLVFVVLAAVPVGLFLILLIGTAVTACIVLLLMEGVVMALGGVALLCILCALAVFAFAISGILSVCYAAFTSLSNYVHLSRVSQKNQERYETSPETAFISSSTDPSNSSKSD